MAGEESNGSQRKTLRLTRVDKGIVDAIHGGPIEPPTSGTDNAASSATLSPDGSQPTADTGTPIVTSGRRRAKRTSATVTVDDRKNKPIVERTASDLIEETVKEIPRLSLEDAKNQAQFITSAVEVMGVMAAGPAGEMSEYERAVITPALARILQRMPIATIQKGGTFIDAGMLGIGMVMYVSRVRRGYSPPTQGVVSQPVSPPSTSSGQVPVQPQQHAPTPAPTPINNGGSAPDPNEILRAQTPDTVSTMAAGDKDGLAVPVPQIISQYMNGSV